MYKMTLMKELIEIFSIKYLFKVYLSCLCLPIFLQVYIYNKTMSGQTKPVHQYFKQLQYMRHKNKLATIQHERPEPNTSALLESVHKLRSQAQTFHHIEHENAITTSNEKLLKRLLSISKRRPTAYAQTVACPVMTSFRNPARKKREKMITQMNQQMAERMLTRESQLGQSSMRKSIQQYERIKRTMTNNKRALSLSRTTQLPSLAISKSKANLKHKEDKGKKDENDVQKSQEKIYTKQEPILIRYEETDEQHVENPYHHTIDH